MRVVFASDVDATKLVGGPSRDVNSGGDGESVFVEAARPLEGAGILRGTRWNDEHAATLRTTGTRRSDGFNESRMMNCTPI